MPQTVSAIQLCNIALGRIGVLQPITSFSDGTAASIACSAAYDFKRQLLLNAFPWGWASKYVVLTQVSSNSAPANAEWAYAYQYPTDCLQIRRIMCTPAGQTSAYPGSQPTPSWNRNDTDAYPAPYEIGYINGAQVIYTDQANATAKYTFDQGDTTPFTPEFAEIFAWAIAVEIAFPLANSMDRREMAKREYDKAVIAGASQALNESQNSKPFQPGNTETIRGRFVG